jgi:hypothetical protein
LIDPETRERAAARLLLDWPTGVEGVLIGGYAVAAYGPPRQSVDVDVVTDAKRRPAWERWLRTHQLVAQRRTTFPGKGAAGIPVTNWRGGNVQFDLMVGGVRDRDSWAVVPAEWILRDPRVGPIELLSGRVEAPVSTVRLEGLWALKLVAGRPHDIADLFGLTTQPAHLDEVTDLLRSLHGPRIRRKFKTLRTRLSDRKTYVDSLSRLSAGSPTDSVNVTAWTKFIAKVDSVLPAD